MEKHCASYVRRVRRRLYCSKAEKVHLLDGLEAEIMETFSQSVPSVSAICERFGTPEEMAQELSAALPAGEKERFLKQRQQWVKWGLAACVLVIVLLAGYLVWLVSIDVRYIDEEIVVVTQSLIN